MVTVVVVVDVAIVVMVVVWYARIQPMLSAGLGLGCADADLRCDAIRAVDDGSIRQLTRGQLSLGEFVQ